MVEFDDSNLNLAMDFDRGNRRSMLLYRAHESRAPYHMRHGKLVEHQTRVN